MSPDYAAEARRWLESWFGAEGAAFRPVASLTALLERLCGEAVGARIAIATPCSPGCQHICLESVYLQERDQARRDLDRKDHEYASIKTDLAQAEAQLSEARAEVERLTGEIDRWKYIAHENRESVTKAEAALEQAKTGLVLAKRCCPDCCEHCYDTALEAQAISADSFKRGKEEGAREQREKDAGIAESFEDQYRTGITIAQAIRGER